MNIDEVANRLTKVSDKYLSEMISAVNKAFGHDSGLSDQEKEQFQQFGQDGVYYGTDIFSDWAEWRVLLNDEAHRRGLGA